MLLNFVALPHSQQSLPLKCIEKLSLQIKIIHPAVLLSPPPHRLRRTNTQIEIPLLFTRPSSWCSFSYQTTSNKDIFILLFQEMKSMSLLYSLGISRKVSGYYLILLVNFFFSVRRSPVSLSISSSTTISVSFEESKMNRSRIDASPSPSSRYLNEVVAWVVDLYKSYSKRTTSPANEITSVGVTSVVEHRKSQVRTPRMGCRPKKNQSVVWYIN